MKKLVLFSSANKQGNTAKLVASLVDHPSTQVVDLDELTITPYNYDNHYPEDDFYPLVEKILTAECVIFASPVYWYAPTATIKVLVDRITELTDVQELKPKARALADKKAYLLATSVHETLFPIFECFFGGVFRYFDMDYRGHLHLNCRDGFAINPQEIEQFNQAMQPKTQPA